MSDRDLSSPNLSSPNLSSPNLSGPNLSGPDVLQRAAAALRAAHHGQREGSGFTRARILASAAERRRPRLKRWLVLLPLGSALLVGSAWAQSTGSWSRVWQAVASVLPFVQPSGEALQRRHPTPLAPREPRERKPAEAPPAEPAAPRAAPLPAALPPAAPLPAALPRAERPRRSAPAPATTAESPAADPELRQFRAAHELHVQGAARGAIAAYDEYLRAYPGGRFVPEARYNSALDWIKLGDHASARRLLQPFASGAHGGYRQTEARKLLDALQDKEPR